LIELMVTLAVAIVLAVLAAPTFSDMVEKSRLRGATDDIVNLLNTSRINATKIERQVNFSVQGTTAWCAGAVSQAGPSTIGNALVPANTPCDCTASTVTCKVGQTTADQVNALVSYSNYSGVTISSSSSNITYSSGAAGEGVTFSPKFGALDPMPADTNKPTITLVSQSGKFSTQITVSALGQTNVCTPSAGFVAGYASC